MKEYDKEDLCWPEERKMGKEEENLCPRIEEVEVRLRYRHAPGA